MMIKAIETKYKGYRFRSRLEARWAVFFDALGVKWEYESEGYILSDGTRYLPDFKIGGFPIEVKPFVEFGKNWMNAISEDDFRDVLSMLELSGEFKSAFVIFGSPFPGEYWIWPSGIDYWPRPMVFGIGRKEHRDFWVVSETNASCIYSPLDARLDDRYPMTDCNELLKAYTAARSARFEHGERPL